jgi:hypothetical protein
VRVARHFKGIIMKVLSELKKNNNDRLLLSEIETIAERLRIVDQSSIEFTELLVLMKKKINQMSD